MNILVDLPLMGAVESEQVIERNTSEIFFERLGRFSNEHPEESMRLHVSLLNWRASAVAADLSEEGTLKGMVASEIDKSVNACKEEGDDITTQEYIEGLFSNNPKVFIQ